MYWQILLKIFSVKFVRDPMDISEFYKRKGGKILNRLSTGIYRAVKDFCYSFDVKMARNGVKMVCNTSERALCIH